eukprot:TRINITY_DN12708_c0_g1_i1.p1 TRINITY_DN12708_c0_g1~~TRINITY_DN12708_c0_g1_i1.p1  ORF type:complete len:647 (+),score=206.02 TRINITY_DN12708_c0_g1_i1:112-2052(+)
MGNVVAQVMPERLRVACPSVPSVSGVYQASGRHNGYPVWSGPGQCRLYTTREGKWMLTEHGEASMEASKGKFATGRHEGMAPCDPVLLWAHAGKHNWREDRAAPVVTVTSADGEPAEARRGNPLLACAPPERTEQLEFTISRAPGEAVGLHVEEGTMALVRATGAAERAGCGRCIGWRLSMVNGANAASADLAVRLCAAAPAIFRVALCRTLPPAPARHADTMPEEEVGRLLREAIAAGDPEAIQEYRQRISDLLEAAQGPPAYSFQPGATVSAVALLRQRELNGAIGRVLPSTPGTGTGRVCVDFGPLGEWMLRPQNLLPVAKPVTPLSAALSPAAPPAGRRASSELRRTSTDSCISVGAGAAAGALAGAALSPAGAAQSPAEVCPRSSWSLLSNTDAARLLSSGAVLFNCRYGAGGGALSPEERAAVRSFCRLTSFEDELRDNDVAPFSMDHGSKDLSCTYLLTKAHYLLPGDTPPAKFTPQLWCSQDFQRAVAPQGTSVHAVAKNRDGVLITTGDAFSVTRQVIPWVFSVNVQYKASLLPPAALAACSRTLSDGVPAAHGLLLERTRQERKKEGGATRLSKQIVLFALLDQGGGLLVTHVIFSAFASLPSVVSTLADRIGRLSAQEAAEVAAKVRQYVRKGLS